MDSAVLVLATMSILLIVAASTCAGILFDVLLKGHLVKQPDKLCIYILDHVYSTVIS